MKKIVSKKMLKEWQNQFQLFLREYRVHKRLTKEGLAKELGVSTPSVEKYESANISKPINGLKALVEFSKLDESLDYTPESFISMLMGKTNEIGEECHYSKELAEIIKNLDSTSQRAIKRSCKNPERLAKMAETLDDIGHSASQNKLKLYKKIKELSENEVKGLLALIGHFQEGK